ncbi:MAG: DUF4139 domain-containing protein [Firmicutes bacterium]|nr:DUF4139 domain-containing protein [Bacillota bacterium]
MRNNRSCLASVVLLMAIALALPWAHEPMRAEGRQLAGGSASPDVTSAASEQVDLALTVYNSNVALVRDVRELQLPAGSVDLRFLDVAASVNPATVLLRSLTAPTRLAVLEQSYEYALLEPQKLFQKYVGREITLVRLHQQDGTTRQEEIKATLLAFHNGPVWKIGNEIVTGLQADHYRFPELPTDLYSRPTLIWKLENSGPARHRIEVSYLAGNLSWSADYVLAIDREDRTAALEGWITLSNSSGIAYENARLRLIAGEVHRAPDAYSRETAEARVLVERAAAAPQLARETFSEYHLYTLARRVSLRHQETRQISLLTAPSVPVEKFFVVEGQSFYYRGPQPPGEPIRNAVQVHYRFRNDETSGLGSPLPAGVVRVYQADADGALQFLGEDRIRHTPRNEALTLYVGNAFDVVCERKQTDYVRLSDRVAEMEFELTLRNQKERAIVVEVNEPFGGDWTLVKSTHQARKTSAWAAQFLVPVERQGAAVLRYRVRTRW